MEFRARSYCLLIIALLTCTGIFFAQNSSVNASSGESYPIGSWESEQPDGTIVGIDLSVVPASIPDEVYPEGTPRPQGSRLQVGVFRGRSQTGHRVESFFITGWTGAGSENGFAAYADRRLQIRFRLPQSGLEIQAELVLDTAKDEWTGRFHRNSFDRQITLHRRLDQPGPVTPALLLTATGTPALFRVEMRNSSAQDLVLNLGFELNEKKQYINAVEYTLTTPDGRVLHLHPMEPAIITGRVDPLIVPLPAGASYSFLVDLDEYGAPYAPGNYTLQASYTGRAVSLGNLDPSAVTAYKGNQRRYLSVAISGCIAEV